MPIFTLQNDVFSPRFRRELNLKACKLFSAINKTEFIPKLGQPVPAVPVRFSPKMTTTAGVFYVPKENPVIEACDIRLSLPLLSTAGWGKVRKVLAHEMCHLWCFIGSPLLWFRHQGHHEEFNRIVTLICGSDVVCSEDLYNIRHR